MTDLHKENNTDTLPENKSSENAEESGRSSSKMTPRRLIAIAAIVLLAGMYLITLFAAIFNPDGSGRFFRFCIGLTIIVPIFAWILIYFTDHYQH